MHATETGDNGRDDIPGWRDNVASRRNSTLGDSARPTGRRAGLAAPAAGVARRPLTGRMAMLTGA